MSLICKFVFEFANDPPKFLPIRVCKRPGCDRFIVPERIGRKEYCSPKCGSRDHRPAAEENKDYIWLYRLTKQNQVGWNTPKDT
jgi:CGNR zinc finger